LGCHAVSTQISSPGGKPAGGEVGLAAEAEPEDGVEEGRQQTDPGDTIPTAGAPDR